MRIVTRRKKFLINFLEDSTNSPSINKIYATLFSGLLFGSGISSVVALELDTGEWSSSINANITVGTT